MWRCDNLVSANTCIPLLWPFYGIGQTIIFLPGGFFLLSSVFLAYQRSDIGCLPFFYTWCGLSANLECRSEMCCTRLAGNTGRKSDAKNRHPRTIAQLCPAISSQLRHISTIGKDLLNSNISPSCPYNMVNFGLLVAEIVSLLWSTPANWTGLAPILSRRILNIYHTSTHCVALVRSFR